jgi:hypothetical protein
MKPTMYRICVQGNLSKRFESALDGMHLEADGALTAFTGEVMDQSQLYGLLDRLRDLGLELVSVEPSQR